jgi:hypothetical protein
MQSEPKTHAISTADSAPPINLPITAEMLRLIGDDLSILANAAVIAGGRAAAAIRFVAHPGTLVHLAQRLQPDLNPPLTPLSTPQRAALDLRAFGSLDNLTLEVGPNGPRIGLPNLLTPPTP